MLKIIKYLLLIIGCLLTVKGILHDNDIFMLIGLFVIIGTFAIQVFGVQNTKE